MSEIGKRREQHPAKQDEEEEERCIHMAEFQDFYTLISGIVCLMYCITKFLNHT